MNAPDKIYLQTCGDCPGFECESCQFQDLAEVSWCEDKIFDTDKEYIRKDALLEWANSLRENARKSRNNPPSIEFDRYMEGKEATLSKLIHKLNEM